MLITILLVPGMALATEQPLGEADQNMTDERLEFIALYNSLFPDADVSDETKLKIIKNMLEAKPIPLPVPENQPELGNKTATLLIAINNATDSETRKEKQKVGQNDDSNAKAGLVAEKFHKSPTVWKELLNAFTESRDDLQVKPVSHKTYDYKVGAKYFCSCYNALVVCKSSWVYNNTNAGSLVPLPKATLPSYASGGFLETAHSVQYIGGHQPQREQVDSWVSVKDGSKWVATCHADHTFTWKTNYKKWTYIVCSPVASGPEREVYSTLGIDME